MTSTLLRWTLVGGLVMSGLAAAQPANDTCAGAELLTLGAPGVTVTSTVATGLNLAAANAEVAMTCGPSAPGPYRTVWYTFVAPTTGSYVVDTCNRANYDTMLQLYEGSCAGLVPLACNDTGTGCTGSTSSVTQVLVGGRTYYAQVGAYFSTGVTSTSTVQLGVTQGSTLTRNPDDTCSTSSPVLQLNSPLVVSSLTPDASTIAPALNDAQLPNDGGCYQGVGNTVSTAAGRDTAYQFRATDTGSYSFRLSAPSSSTPNHVLYVTNSCVPSTTGAVTYDAPVCRAAVNRQSTTTTLSEEAWCVPMSANETLYVWYDETTFSTAGASATLEVTACTAEVEPNSTPAQAGALACPLTGSLKPAADVDYFSLGSPPVGARVFALIDSAATSSSDTRLRVTTATDTLEYDDDDGDALFGGTASNIAGTPLPGGPAFLQVTYVNATTQMEPYRLYSVVQTASPTPEVAPNGDAGVAFAAPSNYFSGTVATTSEVDFYAFEARAGDVVLLSLDSQPTRTGSTASGNHTLQLWNPAGAIVSVNDSNTTVNNGFVTNLLDAGFPALPSEGLWYRIRADGIYYARVGRTSSTGSGDYVLSISLNCGTGGGIGAPTLSSLTPVSGPTAGGQSLTLSGSNFSRGATVTVGGAAATITTRTSSSLVVTTPAGTEGNVDVTVTNPGNQASTLTGGYLYIAPAVAPTVTSVSPATATTLGGTVLTLNGTNFKASAEVTFDVGGDKRLGTNVTLVNSTRLTVTAPAHLPGLADITVRNVVDDLPSTPLVGQLTFLAPPSVSSITPNTGLTSGALTVTIAGANFRTGTTVKFGTVTATVGTIATDGTSLTVTKPTATLNGPVDVTVTNADGQFVTVTNGFTYVYPAPTISSITPVNGFLDGGLSLTINGTNFLAAQALPDGGTVGIGVTLGGLPATGVTRVSATRVTAVTPASGPGTVDVQLTNPDGQQATFAQSFRYIAPPTLASITPVRGPVQGGTRITVTGTDFLPGAVVRVGGVPAFGLSVVSSTEITAVTSAASAGLADVTVTNFDTQGATLPGAYTYDPAPTLTAVSPIVGSTAGGTTVTLTGTDFRAGATVLFGTDPGTAVTVTSPTELTAVSPAHPAGVVSLTVRNDDGQGAELPRAYRFVAPPTVASATPTTGDVAGGTVVRLVGTGFGAQMKVTFGGDESPAVTLVSATALDVVTPPHAPGAVDVVVTTSTGVSATLAGGFTYTRAAPTVAAIAPVTGPEAGGTTVTITGTGFVAGAKVSFDGAMATSVELGSSTLLRAVSPPHAAGAVNVVVTNDDNQSATLTGGFTYVAAPPGTAGVVTDGGTGGLEGPEIDAGTGGGGGSGGGCGCASVDPTTLAGVAFGLVAMLRRRRR